MAKKSKLECPWCGNISVTSPCEHCGGKIITTPAPIEPGTEEEEETETGDGDAGFWIFLIVLFTLFGVSLAILFRKINNKPPVSEPEPTVWSAPSNVAVFTPDYVLNNNVPSLFPSMVICPNGRAFIAVDGAGVCDFSDTHISSLAGGPSDSKFPYGYAYDPSGSFVWAYNLPDLNATKVAQVPWGTSFQWQGCFEINTGNPGDVGGGKRYWTFVYGYGWIDPYQVIGGCQAK